MSLSVSDLTAVAEDLFSDIANNSPSIRLLAHFSQHQTVTIQHSFAECKTPDAYRFTGLNAVRSYFDLLATHYERSAMEKHSMRISAHAGRVILLGSVHWTWRSSRKGWREDFECTIDFDDNLKVISFVMLTTSSPSTCVMRAVDPGPPDINCSRRKKRFDIWVSLRRVDRGSICADNFQLQM